MGAVGTLSWRPEASPIARRQAKSALELGNGTLLGMLPALAVLVRRGAAGRRTTLPYVPALAAGAVIGLFFGDAILDAWLG